MNILISRYTGRKIEEQIQYTRTWKTRHAYPQFSFTYES